MNLKTVLPMMAGALLAGMMTTHAATRVEALAAIPNGGNTTSGYPDFWTENFSTVNDLILGLTPSSLAGNFAPYAGTNATAYNDGILGTIPTPPSSDYHLFSGVGNAGGAELVFDFAEPVNISSIKYFGGWLDQGRDDINFTVSYSTDGGSTYTALIDTTGITYGYYNGGGFVPESGDYNSGNTTTFTKVLAGNGPNSNYVNVYDDTDTYLGANAAITNVKFNFGDVANGWSGLEELVVTGVAVPEPGTWGLVLSAGLLGLCAVNHRRRRI